MLGRENTGAALGSGAVDDDFWALVCEDEELAAGGVRRDRQRALRDPGPAIGAAHYDRCRVARPGGVAAQNIRNHPAVANREPTRQAVAAAGTITSGWGRTTNVN